MPNRIVCVDGVERGIANGGRDLINHAPWFQAEFERHLRALSVERGLVPGWEFHAGDQQYEVIGSDPVVRALYSQGNADVQDELDALLEDETDGLTRSRRRVLDGRAKRTVTATKDDQTRTWAEIRQHMTTRAADDGIDLARCLHSRPAAAVHAARRSGTPPPGPSRSTSTCASTSPTPSTSRSRPPSAHSPPMTGTTPASTPPPRPSRPWRSFPGKTPAARPGGAASAHGSSPPSASCKAEKAVMDAFTAGFDQNPHRLDPADADELLQEWMQHSGRLGHGQSLTDGQLALYREMTTGSDLTGMVVGSAGSGKTTALDAVRHALGRRGITVYGVSTSAIATQGLKDAARIDGSTVARLLARIAFATDPAHPARQRVDQLESTGSEHDRRRAAAIRDAYALPSMDHLVVDEASMLAVTEKAQIMEWAQREHVRVTLVGDHKQLKAIGPSSLFAEMIKVRGAVELTENLRQKTPLGRDCAAFLRDEKPRDALQILAAANQFRVARSEVDKNRLLIESWLQKAAAMPTAADRMRLTGLDADRNDQVDVLNHLARHWARSQRLAHRERRHLQARRQRTHLRRRRPSPDHPQHQTSR